MSHQFKTYDDSSERRTNKENSDKPDINKFVI